MGIYEEELAGGEFDWFAIDTNGDLAIFATAGEGTIPNNVISHYIEHSQISESLETPNWGSTEIWNDYAKLGLFVFDWNLPGGPYLREKTPIGKVPNELKEKIMMISSLEKLEISFSKMEQVEL